MKIYYVIVKYKLIFNLIMAKIYPQEALKGSKILPKKETIQFLLNYSKALNIFKVGKKSIEVLAN